MKKTNAHSNRLLLFLLVLFIMCFCLHNLILAQAPDFVLPEKTGQTIRTKKALLWENDWTLQPDYNHYFGTTSKLFHHGMAYLGDDRVLMFGGIDVGYVPETYVYDLSGNNWYWKDLSTYPDCRTDMGMAHIGGDKVLLFGGFRSYGNWYDHTWIYDDSENGWTQQYPATKPEKRHSHAMAYIGNDKVLLFGGLTRVDANDAKTNDETWIYDLSENNWIQKNPTSAPSARDAHAMVYFGGDRVLLFGGNTNWPIAILSDETWIYDLSEDNWTQQNPANKPEKLYEHDMAYIGGGQVVLFGGMEADGSLSSETWIYDLNLNTWIHDINGPGPTPIPWARYGHGFSETSMDGSSRPVLFGGKDSEWGEDNLSTWVYGGGDYGPTDLTTITVLQPNGGETWYVGTSYNITWECDVYVGTVNIQLSTSGGSSWHSVTTNTDNDGSYPYTPDQDKISNQCLIRVTSNEAPTVSDVSDNLFTIAETSANPAPTNLISLNGYHQAVPLTWKAPSSGTPQGYNVYRNSQLIASNLTRTYYRDETVPDDQTYNYQVTAVYSGGESDFSNNFYGNAMSNGYYINAGWASSAPNLDGNINSGEWSNAATRTISYPGESGTVRLYVMNDDNYLYFAVDDAIDNSLDNDDTFGIVFDDNHDRELPSSTPSDEGLIQMYWDNSASNTFLGTYGYFPDNLNYDGWTTPSGVSQGIAQSSGHVQYEGRIDLNSSPLQSSPGNNIGITFYTWDGASSSLTGIWPEAILDLQSYASGYGWFYGPFSYGDIELSSSGDTPGSKKWEFVTGHGVSSSPAIGSDGTIYVGCNDRKLYAINPDGTKKWEFETGDYVISSPAIGSDGTIYVGSDDEKLYAMNPNGTKKWEFVAGHRVRSSPAIGSDGTIYVGSADKKLYAINPDGTKKWEFESLSWIESSPAIGSDGTIYVVSFDQRLYAINPDGTTKWDKGIIGDAIVSSPSIDSDGTIYIGGSDHRLYAINPDGSTKWYFETGDKILSSPSIGSDGTIYFGSYDNKLYAVNNDGTKKWDFLTGDVIYSASPAIGSDGTIYIGSNDERLYAVNPDGTEKWDFLAGGRVQSSPVVDADGTIYVGSDNHKLYAINGNSGGLADTPWPMFHQNVRHTGRAEISPGVPRAVRFAAPGDYVEVAHSNSIAPSEFTIEFWLRVNALGDPQIAGGEQTIIDKRGDNDTGYNLRLAGTTFPISFHAIAGPQGVSTDNVVFQFIWYHIAVTQDSDSLKLYFDGERIAAVANLYPANTNAPLRIGEFLGYPGAYLGLRGDIDEMRIWNYARNQSDIQTTMRQKLSGSESGLAAYWDFDSESDGIISDLTTNGNHGVMHGNATLIELENVVAVEDNSSEVIPRGFMLWQNYPNPFNPTTTIRYAIQKPATVTLMVYNLKGKRVKQLVAQNEPPGMYYIIWDGTNDSGRNVAGGIYIYTIQVGDYQQSRKMILLR